MGNFTRVFKKDCGKSLACMEAFVAETVTYTLGYESDFVIGRSRYRLRPEEIVMFAFGGLIGAVALSMSVVGLTRLHYFKVAKDAPVISE